MNIPGYDNWKLMTPEEDHEGRYGKRRVPDAPRVIGTYCGSLQGVEYKVMVGDRCFFVGAPTLAQLKAGKTPDELDLFEVDPDEEERVDW